MGGRRGSYAKAARAEYPARPYASCAPLPRYGYCSAGGFTAAFSGAPADPAPLAPDVGVTGFEIGVLGFSSSFLAEGVDALLDVPDLMIVKIKLSSAALIVFMKRTFEPQKVV